MRVLFTTHIVFCAPILCFSVMLSVVVQFWKPRLEIRVFSPLNKLVNPFKLNEGVIISTLQIVCSNIYLDNETFEQEPFSTHTLGSGKCVLDEEKFEQIKLKR